ncbi:hypothetical protein LCGC14_2317030, partial [marine sediment metagenome]
IKENQNIEITMPKFKINEFLMLKLESGHTSIYINDENSSFIVKTFLLIYYPTKLMILTKLIQSMKQLI